MVGATLAIARAGASPAPTGKLKCVRYEVRLHSGPSNWKKELCIATKLLYFRTDWTKTNYLFIKVLYAFWCRQYFSRITLKTGNRCSGQLAVISSPYFDFTLNFQNCFFDFRDVGYI